MCIFTYDHIYFLLRHKALRRIKYLSGTQIFIKIRTCIKKKEFCYKMCIIGNMIKDILKTVLPICVIICKPQIDILVEKRQPLDLLVTLNKAYLEYCFTNSMLSLKVSPCPSKCLHTKVTKWLRNTFYSKKDPDLRQFAGD